MRYVSRFFPAALVACAIATSPAAAQDFTVASGDVTTTSAVLWALPDGVGPVTFEYGTDPTFASTAGSVVIGSSDLLVPVKAEITGLIPGQTYFYRATFGGTVSTGRFNTAALPGDRNGFRFGMLTDWQQDPTFPAIKNVPARGLDLIVKGGDTIYADAASPASGIFPEPTQARTLAEFRTLHREIVSARTDVPGFTLNTMRDAYRTAHVLNTIDDHEVVDNFAGGALPGLSPDAPDIGSSSTPLFTTLGGTPIPPTAQFVNETTAYQDAMRAVFDYHPLVNTTWSGTGDARLDGKPRLYRSQSFGATAAVTMLDSRSFRDDQIAPVNFGNPATFPAFIAGAFNPTRTLLGRPQVERLKSDLLAQQQAGVTWKFITIPEPIQNFGFANAEDRFEGYAAERTEILAFIQQAGITNVVFISGDFHGTSVNDLAYQIPGGAPTPTNPFGFTDVRTGAFEVMAGPVAFFDGRFGPNVANLAAAAGLISAPELAFYNSLPINPDADSALNDKDDFVKNLVNAQIDFFYAANPVGLDDSTLIDATLVQGDWLVGHNFAWTEFDIEPGTNFLTVTLWGIEAYSEEDQLLNPAAIEARTPVILSQFVVRPTPRVCPADVNDDGFVTLADFMAFFTAFDVFDAAADLDNSGETDFADFLRFFNSYDTSCL